MKRLAAALALLLGAALGALACGDDDAGECTMDTVCGRNVSCKIVASVAQCKENVGTCPNQDAFVQCMCECQADADGCDVEHCIPDCQSAC